MATALERAEKRVADYKAASLHTPELESKEPITEPATTPEPELPTTPESQPDEEIISIKEELRKAKASLSTLQGMFKKEVSDGIAQAKRELISEKKELEAKLAIAEAALELPAMKAGMTERFGDDADKIAEFVQKTLDSKLKAATKPLTDELENVKSRQANADSRTFFSTLKMLVPDYVEVNSSPIWLEWLEETDSLSGDKKIDILLSAQDKGDALKVANVFNEFKKTLVKQDVKKPDKTVLLAPGKSRNQSREETPQITLESLGKMAQAIKTEMDPRKRTILQNQFYEAHKVFKATDEASRGLR